MDEAVVDHTLSSAERAQFEADGFLVLPEVLSHNDVASLSDAMDEWSDSMGGVAEGSTWHGMIFDQRHDTPFWHAALVQMLYHPKVFGKVVGILGWNIYCYHAHAMFTRAVSGSPGSMLMEPLGDHWHQDSGRVNEDVEGDPRPRLSVKVSYFLTDTTQPGAPHFWAVPGSHLNNSMPNVHLGATEQPPGAKRIPVPAGSVVIIDRRLWHAGPLGEQPYPRSRKVLFYGFGQRWMRPKDSMATDRVLAHIRDPVIRQLLGETPTYNGLYSPTARDVPLMGWLDDHGMLKDRPPVPWEVFALAFAGDVRLSEPATVMLKEMLELRPNLLLNRLDEAFREAFLALLCGTPVHLGEALAPQQLAGLGDVYAERFRKQKAIRDSFLRKALQQMQKLNFGRFEERFAELAALGVVDEESESRRAPGTPRRAKVGQLPLRQRQQLLYAQFIASAVGALPFAFESEPLLLVFDCNHHLSLHAGTLLASFEGEDLKNPPAPDQVFVDALSIVSCVVLKSMLKREFNLSAEQCATFNPRDLRQERIKSFPVVFREKDEGAVKSRFPAAEWLEKVLPLVDNVGKPKEIAAYIRRLTDADPWDDSRARHENKVDALEGRRGRRKKVGPAPTPGRGRGRGKAAEKAAEPKKKGKRRGYESEDDSDFEGPKGKRPRARREPREPREEVEAAEERTAVELLKLDLRQEGIAFPLTGTIVQTSEAVGKWSVPAKASPARSREQPSEPQPEPSREPSHRRLTRMPLAPSADPTQRAQDIASALTDAAGVDSALRSAVAGLKTQICRRAENAADETEATRACYRLLQQLLERHQARAQRFETFALDYLLKMPPEGPSEPPAAGAASALDEEITGLAVPAAWKPKESQSFLEQVHPALSASKLDQEISKVQTQLVQSLRKAHAQRREVMHLKQRLSLARAAEEAAGKGGLRRLARELTEVAQQVGQLTGKENRGYENRAFAEIQASPKRRGFLEELEEWPETPKRQRHSLLG
ncbi:unnamed protein product [Effrenium voratum]|nr:unnamed protein product [Effrenium voratum]